LDIAAEIRKQIDALTAALNALEGKSNGRRALRKLKKSSGAAKRTLSAKARRAISKAQKTRWALWKKAKQR
jgi:hypothetical protein